MQQDACPLAAVEMEVSASGCRIAEALAATILIQRWIRSTHRTAASVSSVDDRSVVSAAAASVRSDEMASTACSGAAVRTAGASGERGAVRTAQRSRPAAAAPATVVATAVPPDDASWLEDGCASLVARAANGRKPGNAAQRAKDSDEARARSAALSTKADTTGVQFRGREFQRLYLESKFVRRATLVYQLLSTVLEAPGPSAARDLFAAELTAAGSGKRRLEV